MFWILWRDRGTTTLFEGVDREDASKILESVVLDTGATLIDYSYSLDGALDELLARLDSVKIGYPVETVKAA